MQKLEVIINLLLEEKPLPPKIEIINYLEITIIIGNVILNQIGYLYI